MKKKILAVTLAILMIVSCCVLCVSALTASAGSYVRKINTNGDLLVDNLTTIVKGTDFSQTVEVTPKSSISMNTGTTEITGDNVDELFTFKAGTSTLTYSSNLSPYFNVSGTISGNDAQVTFTDKSANTMTVFRVDTAIASTDTGNVSGKLTPETASRYILAGGGTYSATISKWVTKLSKITMGVRFYGSTYDNLAASEIAVVKAEVRRQSGAVSRQTSSVSNEINDLLTGDKIYLETSLKNPEDKEYYAFNCWVDGSGEVLSTSPAIERPVKGDASYYACYVELKDRYSITYSIEGNGKMINLDTTSSAGGKSTPKARSVFSGEGIISIMEGKDFTFTFVPDEGYEISKVMIDGTTNVASFKSLLSANDILQQIKVLINATGADRELGKDKIEGAYTFKSVNKDHSIKVVFTKSAPLEAPSGLEMALVAPEGVELETKGDAPADAAAAPGADGGTTVPAENGGLAIGGVVNPATGSSSASSAVAVFAVMTVAAGAAFVTMKKKKD